MTSDAAFREIFAGLLHQRCEALSASHGEHTLSAEAKLIERLVSSTHTVFTTMLDFAVRMAEAPRPGCAVHHFELSGVSGLVGPMRATVAIGLPRQLAFTVVEKLVGTCPQEIDADVIDAVGELANMIVGTTKRGLDDCRLAIEIPTVIFGQGHRVTFSANMNRYVLPFLTEFGPFQIEVGIDDHR